jgi:hypothetical protein
MNLCKFRFNLGVADRAATIPSTGAQLVGNFFDRFPSEISGWFCAAFL